MKHASKESLCLFGARLLVRQKHHFYDFLNFLKGPLIYYRNTLKLYENIDVFGGILFCRYGNLNFENFDNIYTNSFENKNEVRN